MKTQSNPTTKKKKQKTKEPCSCRRLVSSHPAHLSAPTQSTCPSFQPARPTQELMPVVWRPFPPCQCAQSHHDAEFRFTRLSPPPTLSLSVLHHPANQHLSPNAHCRQDVYASIRRSFLTDPPKPTQKTNPKSARASMSMFRRVSERGYTAGVAAGRPIFHRPI